MLFRKKMYKSCSYCSFSASLEGGLFLCTKKGVVNGNDKCRTFLYDPTKRIPTKPKALDFNKYNDDDFSL